ncbi:hypothetical protein DCAR_0104520 [Daucus carota subsp. sativus]|uniref:Uncharacterized protein n=1 Tax=Daucus carota subsp. sativus TaxID=79200 RepID=A0A166IWN5_DAUCS|nr:hypothetical protein DCAR_0104520 [Daucus carota subsp. sativus]
MTQLSDRDIAAAQVQPGTLASPHVCPQSLCQQTCENFKNVPIDLFHFYIVIKYICHFIIALATSNTYIVISHLNLENPFIHSNSTRSCDLTRAIFQPINQESSDFLYFSRNFKCYININNSTIVSKR